MYFLKGTLINCYETPKGKKDGEEYGGDSKIQIMHETILKNGERRMDLVEMVVSDISKYADKLQQTVTVPVSLSVWQGKLSVKAND